MQSFLLLTYTIWGYIFFTDLIKKGDLKCVIATIPTVNAKTASAVTTVSAAKTANAAARTVRTPIKKKIVRQKKKNTAAAAKNKKTRKAETKAPLFCCRPCGKLYNKFG